MEDIQAKFPDEFSDEPDRKNAQVLHISGEEESEFSEIISYLVDRTYPAGLSREEKSMFQSKVAPYTIIQGVLFRIGEDKVIFIKMRQNHNFETWRIEAECFQESLIIPLNSTSSHSHLRQQ